MAKHVAKETGDTGAPGVAGGDNAASTAKAPEASRAAQSTKAHKATKSVVKHVVKPVVKKTKLSIEARAVQAGFDFHTPGASGALSCGVDEAGRGPLAGPVVAAAVILDPARPIKGLDDSKALSAKVRERLYHEIIERAMSYSIAEASVDEIDTINILHATMLAMRRAVEGLSIVPDLAHIDGNRCPTLSIRAQAVVGGDALLPSISAASILAKVTRDRMLRQMHIQHPEYGFGAHMGYGTRQHLAALQQHGPCVHHRRSFAPVREAWARQEARGAAGAAHQDALSPLRTTIQATTLIVMEQA